MLLTAVLETPFAFTLGPCASGDALRNKSKVCRRGSFAQDLERENLTHVRAEWRICSCRRPLAYRKRLAPSRYAAIGMLRLSAKTLQSQEAFRKYSLPKQSVIGAFFPARAINAVFALYKGE